MRRVAIGFALSTGLLLTSGSALAQALAWQMTEVSGPVMVVHGGERHLAARGAMLAPGDAVETGAGGRAVMVHDKDFVTLAARSRATVPGAAEQASGFTKLLQDLGNAVYRIEKRGVPHFGVTTPYLAAVVKGTTFSITVDERGSTLQVVEGAVEVATPDGGARDLILPAGVASVSATDRLRLTVHGDSERVIDSPARQVSAAPAAPAAPAAAPTPVTSQPPAESPTLQATGSAINVTGSIAPAENDIIVTPVASRPIDLAALSGGLVTGNAGFTALTATVVQTDRAVEATAAAAAAAAAKATPTILAAVAAAPSTTPLVQPAVLTTPAAGASPVVATVPVVAAVPAIATTPVVTTPVAAIATPIEAIATTPVIAASVPGTTATPVAVAVATVPVATAAVTVPVATSPVVTPALVTPVTVPAVATPGVSVTVTTPVVAVSIATPVVAPIAAAVGAVPVVTPPAVTTPVAAIATTPVATTPVVTTPVVTTPAVTGSIFTAPGQIVSALARAGKGAVLTGRDVLLGEDSGSGKK